MARKRTEGRTNLCVLVATISLVVLADRMALAWVGLPYWIVDERIHYRHRPGVTRTWLTGNPSTASDLGFAISSYASTATVTTTTIFPWSKLRVSSVD